jgi:hypothetical protein
MCIGLHVKCPLLLSDFNDEFLQQIFEKYTNIKFHEYPSSASLRSIPMTQHTHTHTHAHTDRRSERQTWRMLYVVLFLLGESPTSEFYVLKFRNTLNFPPSCICVRRTRQSVPKLRHIKFRRRGIIQKKEYNGHDEGNKRYSQFRAGA